ncbi:alpha-actinin-4-like [Dendronephthya gigantea]|uniref:alpha-actinin-4-like n=1 Tax=Dendronephthya gigantea TaxID=151771 RepID=UPI00106B2E28|nr:alpha-actinin-4-like [Dendronephthya gigantea]
MSATLITQIRKDHDDIHIKTYTRWLNWKLGKAGPVVKNLIEDLQDGRVLISLARVLLNVKIKAESTDSEIHQKINVQKALDIFMKNEVKLVAIHASRIVSGDQATILALVWNIILRFQIPDDNVKIKERLLKWVQDVLQGYSDIVIVEDILESWQNGLAFILLMFVYRPNVVDIAKARKMSVVARMEYAFLVAEKEFGVDRFFDPLRVTLKCPNYDEWKESVAELERILGREEAKFVPNSDIKKEFSNLERLAQETKDSGEIVESVCKPKLATISSVGKELIDSKELDPSDDKNIAKKIDELTDRIQRLDTAVRETRERYDF